MIDAPVNRIGRFSSSQIDIRKTGWKSSLVIKRDPISFPQFVCHKMQNKACFRKRVPFKPTRDLGGELFSFLLLHGSFFGRHFFTPPICCDRPFLCETATQNFCVDFLKKISLLLRSPAGFRKARTWPVQSPSAASAGRIRTFQAFAL